MPGSRAEVAYMVQGNQVIFSSTGNVEGQAPTTVNAAEKVIRAICDAEGVYWRELEFFDFQTRNGGYLRHGVANTTALDQLIFDQEAEHLKVQRWKPIFDTDLGIGTSGMHETLFQITAGNQQ